MTASSTRPTAPTRPALSVRRRPAWVLLTLIGVPVLEIVVIIAVGHAIGFWPTVLALIAMTALGSYLLRREGHRTWQSLRDSMRGVNVDGVTVRPRAMPTQQLGDGALVVVGAVLLIVPGFLTDILGIVCLLPATRPLPRKMLGHLLARRTQRLIGGGYGRAEPAVQTWTVVQEDPQNGSGPAKPAGPRIIEPPR